ERSDGDIPFKAAFERHRVACRYGANEAQCGQNCQREAGCKTVAFHAFAPFGLRYNGETSFPARRPSARAVPGRWGACLAVSTSPATFRCRFFQAPSPKPWCINRVRSASKGQPLLVLRNIFPAQMIQAASSSPLERVAKS